MSQPQRGSKSAWIVGATSFLGGHVAGGLAKNGYNVIGLSRGAVAHDFAALWGFTAVETGPIGPGLFERAARLGTPSVVFHAVGSGSVGQAHADPEADMERTLGTLKILIEALRRIAPSARLIYPSSAAIYGHTGPGPIQEAAPTQPISVYGRHKLLAETMCRDAAWLGGLDVVIPRFFSVYGVPQRKLLLWDLGRRLLAGEHTVTLGGTGEETRDFIDVSDAAAVVVALAKAPKPPPIVNVGTGQAVSVKSATHQYAAALKIVAKIDFSGISRPEDPPHQQADIALLQSLGFTSFISLATGFSKYANWLRETLRGRAED